MDFSPLMQGMVAITLDASHKIMEVYNSDFAAEEKADGSAVTEADKAGEAVILAGLKNLAPEIPVLAEEEAAAGNIPELGQKFFLVDPVDGTREFVNRTGEFTINIALIEDGKPMMGVVYAPASDRLYIGETGKGAVKIMHKPSDELDYNTAVKIETRVPTKDLIAVASRSHRSAETETLLKELGVIDFTPAGSSLKFCLVAEGIADVYPRLGRTMEWDTGAGQAVLEAAGGRVMEFVDGAETKTPLVYNKAQRGFDNPYFIAWAK